MYTIHPLIHDSCQHCTFSQALSLSDEEEEEEEDLSDQDSSDDDYGASSITPKRTKRATRVNTTGKCLLKGIDWI